MSDFKIGEIVIGQNSTGTPEFNGMELEVVARGVLPYRERRTGNSIFDVFGYYVVGADGLKRFAKPHQLRRRKPPAADSNERTFMQKWRDMSDKAPQRVEVPA